MRRKLRRAVPFEKYQVDYLQSLGLIKGGSLDNAVVLDGETVLNPAACAINTNASTIKVLDAVGDFVHFRTSDFGPAWRPAKPDIFTIIRF